MFLRRGGWRLGAGGIGGQFVVCRFVLRFRGRLAVRFDRSVLLLGLFIGLLLVGR